MERKLSNANPPHRNGGQIFTNSLRFHYFTDIFLRYSVPVLRRHSPVSTPLFFIFYPFFFLWCRRRTPYRRRRTLNSKAAAQSGGRFSIFTRPGHLLLSHLAAEPPVGAPVLISPAFHTTRPPASVSPCSRATGWRACFYFPASLHDPALCLCLTLLQSRRIARRFCTFPFALPLSGVSRQRRASHAISSCPSAETSIKESLTFS